MLLSLLIACPPIEDGPSLYATAEHAPSLHPDDIAALDHLGATVIDDGVNFGVYSARAERVELLLFADPDDDLPIQQFPLTRIGDAEGSPTWNCYVEGVGYGQSYGFIAWGANWPYDPEFYPNSLVGFISDVDSDGNRFNPNKLLTDPYGRALHREHDWGRASLGTGESRRSESTWGASSKSLVIRSDYEWSDNESTWIEQRKAGEHHDWNELVLYEVHPKGLTQNGLEEVEHPGTFQGIGEMAPYLQDLGITVVELMPVHEKPLDGGYWGYNNISFFAMELDYSSAYKEQGRPDLVVDEFKEMVDQLHQHGIEVMVDVVYNHTGEGGLWREKLFYNDYSPDPSATAQAVNLDSVEVAGLYNLRGLDNWSYYALQADGLTYWNNSGVGNQTRPNHVPMQRLTLDSLHYMVEELHVDGFRFDLAGILGEQDQNYNEWYEDPTESLLGVIADDPVIQEHNVRLVSEPWTAGGWYNPLLGAYPASTTKEGFGWMEWNGHFRDVWRSLINEGTTLDHYEGAIGAGGALTGSSDMYAWNGRKPYHSVNFITVHDGMTLYDLFSYGEKENGCGVLNPVCCDDPFSAWCDTDSGENHNRSKDWGDEALKRQMMRNMFTFMMVSHGTPLILGGDEWMRTQYGNNNAYSTSADNEWNWFRWGEWRAYDERHRMNDFVSELIAWRMDHLDQVSPDAYDQGGFAWKNAANTDKTDWSNKHLAIHYYEGEQTLILINMEDSEVTFTLPSDSSWERVLDTQAWWDDGYLAENPELEPRATYNILRDAPIALTQPEYGVPPKTIVILEQQ